jgi:hypothetical protein
VIVEKDIGQQKMEDLRAAKLNVPYVEELDDELIWFIREVI